MDYKPTRLLCPRDSPGKNTEWVAVPSSRDLPDPGIEPASLMSPALAGRVLTTRATWEARRSEQAPHRPHSRPSRNRPRPARFAHGRSGGRVDSQTLTGGRGRRARRSGPSAACHSSPARPRRPWTGWRCGDKHRGGSVRRLSVVKPPSGESGGQRPDRKSTRLNSSHRIASRMPSSA